MSQEELESDQSRLQAASFDISPRRRNIRLFRLGKHWAFKHFFDDKEPFLDLAEFYNEEKYRFEFKTAGERNKALKILERAGFDYELVEDLHGYVVKVDRFSKYASILKNSVAHMETPKARIFLMKDRSAAKEAQRMGAKLYAGDYGSLIFR